MESPGAFCFILDVTTNDCIDISEEVLNTFDVTGLPTHVLHLKENMPGMLISKGIWIFALYFKPRNKRRSHIAKVYSGI